ncbi:MAG: AAA family ATPase [Thermoplasmata archaeon]
MPKDLVIKSITIEGMRGFNNAQTINLDGSHALIFGPMGTGKSSTLCAIEWALFGDIAHIKCSESRTQAEFVNANKIDQMARVTLKLKGDDGEYIIYREKHARKRDSNLTFTTPYGDFEGEEAANQIYSIFGTFDDFHRSIFLHQEAVRAILTENPEERDMALDRLLGLERTRELMSALPVKLVQDEYKKLEYEKTRIEERITGATRQAEFEMERAERKAFELGLKKEDLTYPVCKNKFEEIIKDISTMAEDCGIEKPSFSELTVVEDISRELEKVKNVIKNCRRHLAATSKVSKLQKDRERLNRAKKELESALSELKEAIEEYEQMKEEWGTIDQIEKQENHLNLKEEKLKEEREKIDSISKLISDAIEVLSRQKLKNCPVCDTKISSDEVLTNLRTKVIPAITKRLSEIDSGRETIREELLQIKERKRVIFKMIEKIEQLEKAKGNVENALREILFSKSKGSEILIREAKEKLSTLEKELASAEKALSEKNEILEGIEDAAELCRAIVNVLEKKAEYEKIKETFAKEVDQIVNLKTRINEIATLYNQLQRISEAIAMTQINLAREFISKGEKMISDYYDRLCCHPYYNNIRIDIVQRNIRGVQKNTYNIKAYNNKEGKETLISTRFSTGQMNCAALSIFLSLSSILNRKTKFLIFDDPSQNLDIEHKKALVNVLGEVSSVNQIIIATQDNELFDEIATSFMPTKGYTILTYEKWSKEGPTIKISKREK